MRYLSRKRVLTEFEDREGAWHLLSDGPA
jgi:hypothetical protein